eukprot:5436527-Pleurochrysis_carterae.AAC.2
MSSGNAGKIVSSFHVLHQLVGDNLPYRSRRTFAYPSGSFAAISKDFPDKLLTISHVVVGTYGHSM